jgi:hypothetical protein
MTRFVSGFVNNNDFIIKKTSEAKISDHAIDFPSSIKGRQNMAMLGEFRK